jgi:DNA-directed RNA polymerase
MDWDYRRSLKRVAKSETYRGRSGFGFTGQASVVRNEYLAALAQWVGVSLADKRRSRDVRRAVRGLNDEDVAARLLLAGISAAMAKRFGVDEDGNKTPRDTTVWIGYNFACATRDAAYRTGVWAIRGLLTLPFFKLDEDGILVIVDTDELQDLMGGFLRSAAAHNPLLSPQESPPIPWNGFRSGGLESDHWHKPKLVRTNHNSVENIIRRAIATGAMQSVLDAINALQSVAFVINRPILDLVKRVGPPPAPDSAMSEQKAGEMTAAIWNWEYDRTIAEAVSQSVHCYAPLTMDPRGRLIPIPWLNFIREDRVRGLFFFANGEPINDDGVIWLKQFVARLADGNRFGDERKPSRLDLDGRIAWTDRNLSKIVDIGAAVFYGDTPDLGGIDDRFQFAAACAELTAVIAAAGDGSDFITRLPIQLDAKCSGLQNLCAMARADEGKYVAIGPPPPDHYVYDVMPGTTPSDTHFVPGKLVNLGPEELPDIYSLVQAEVHVDHPEFGDIVHPLERKLAKAPVMTKFYGCGLKKMAKQIGEALLGLDDPAAQSFRTDDKQEELAEAFRAAIKRIAPKATELFEWLQRLAAICAKHGVLLRWTTPLGFPAVNEYHPSITKQMKRPIIDKSGKQVLRNGKPVFRYTELAVGYKDSVKIGKAITAAAANFVHSADACLLQMIALACEQEAIPMVSVHDCFATTANHAGRLKEICGERFLAMYEYDWLDNVWQSARSALPKSVELPPIPKRGNLNIQINFHTFS